MSKKKEDLGIKKIKKIALLGDIFSHQWLPAIEQIIDQEPDNKYYLQTYLLKSCKYEMINYKSQAQAIHCPKKISSIFVDLLSYKPDIIIYSEKIITSITAKLFEQLMLELLDITSNIIYIQTNHFTSTLDVQQCFNQYKNPQKCTLNHKIDTKYQKITYIKEYMKILRQQKRICLKYKIKIIDMTDLFHYQDQFPPIINRLLVYRDNNAITKSYILHITPVLKQRMQQYL